MANTDYVLRNRTFGFCPYAYLLSSISKLQQTVVMTGYRSPFPNGIRQGMAAMLGSGPSAEIVVVESFVENVLTLGRGCCDTVPQAHTSGTIIWFFDDSIARDIEEYAATETIAVKVLPRTLTGGAVPIEASPAATLGFNSRFARPYPPGNVRINGTNIEGTHVLNDGAVPLTLSWAHRDRVEQADALIKHQVANVGPEPGTTYTVQVLNLEGAVVRTQSGITGTSWEYLSTDARIDLEEPREDASGFLRLKSVRDGLDSWQFYVIPFALIAPSVIRNQALVWNIDTAPAPEIEGFNSGFTNTGTLGGTYFNGLQYPDGDSSVTTSGGALQIALKYNIAESNPSINIGGATYINSSVPALPTGTAWTFKARFSLNVTADDSFSSAENNARYARGAAAAIRIQSNIFILNLVKESGASSFRVEVGSYGGNAILAPSKPLSTEIEVIAVAEFGFAGPNVGRNRFYIDGALVLTQNLTISETLPEERELSVIAEYTNGGATYTESGSTVEIRNINVDAYISQMSFTTGYAFTG